MSPGDTVESDRRYERWQANNARLAQRQRIYDKAMLAVAVLALGLWSLVTLL